MKVDKSTERVLRERAQRLAQKGQGGTKETSFPFVIVALGTEQIGIAAGRLSQVVPRPKMIAIPHAPAWCVGMAAFRGEFLTVVDLQRQQGRPSLTTGAQAAILEGSDGLLALLVDRVVEVRRMTPSELTPHFASGPFSAMARDLVSILDVDSFFTASRMHAKQGSRS